MQMSFFTARACKFIINDNLRLVARRHNYSLKPFFHVFGDWQDETHTNCKIEFVDA